MSDETESAQLIDPFGAGESETVYTTAEPRNRPWLLIAVAAAVLASLVGFFAVAGDTADSDNADSDDGVPDEPAPLDDPSTSPDATDPAPASEPEPGARVFGRLDFAEVGELATGRLVGTAELGDSLFAFTDPTESSGPFAGVGFERILAATERSADGAWIDHGTVIEGIDVRGVAQYGTEVVAIGIDAAGHSAVWRSADGLAWTAEELPPLTDATGEPAEPSRVIANGETIIVFAQTADDDLRFDRELEDAGVSVDLTSGHRIVGDRLQELGPFWFVVREYDLGELGIAPPRVPVGPPATGAWVNDGTGWTVTDGDGTLAQVGTLPDGRFVRTITDDQRQLQFSVDALTWETTNLPPFPDSAVVTTAEALLVHDTSRVWRSTDGETWEQIIVPEPPRPADEIVDVHAENGTIAATIRRIETSEQQEVALLQDGFLVRFGGENRSIRLEQDGVITHEIDGERAEAADHRFDPARGLTFLGPDGAEITTLSMDTLTWIFAEVHLDPERAGWREVTSILVSGEDDVWTRTPMFRIRSEGTLADVVIRDGVVMAFVIPSEDPNLRGELPILVYEAPIEP